MVQLTIAHPTSLTLSKFQGNLFDDFNGSLFHLNVDFPIKHTPFHGRSPYGLPFHIDPSMSRTSSGLQYLQPLHIQSLSWNLFHLLSITYHYHLRHNSQLSTHSRYISLPCMIFECYHNIWNHPVSTTIPSQSPFRDITTIRKHRHFGEILKYVFSYCF